MKSLKDKLTMYKDSKVGLSTPEGSESEFGLLIPPWDPIVIVLSPYHVPTHPLVLFDLSAHLERDNSILMCVDNNNQCHKINLPNTNTNTNTNTSRNANVNNSEEGIHAEQETVIVEEDIQSPHSHSYSKPSRSMNTLSDALTALTSSPSSSSLILISPYTMKSHVSNVIHHMLKQGSAEGSGGDNGDKISSLIHICNILGKYSVNDTVCESKGRGDDGRGRNQLIRHITKSTPWVSYTNYLQAIHKLEIHTICMNQCIS